MLRLVQMAARSLQSQQKPSVATRHKNTCPLLPVNLGLGLFLNRYTRRERKECVAQLSWLHNTKDILNRHHISGPHIRTPLATTSEQDKHPEVIWVKNKSCPHIKSGRKGKSCTKNRFSNWTADIENPKKEQEQKECTAKTKPGFVVEQYQGHSEPTLTTLYPTHHNLSTQHFNTIRTFKQS